uniref:Uncharacterized protein n=1 Tax=Rhizophora mucronata TaxID=61149 RepID=A0A2P2N4L0_RHIMU
MTGLIFQIGSHCGPGVVSSKSNDPEAVVIPGGLVEVIVMALACTGPMKMRKGVHHVSDLAIKLFVPVKLNSIRVRGR